MLRESELARRVDGRIELRVGGLRVQWRLTDLVTSDGHTAHAYFTSTVRGLPDPTEQKMLEESLLSSRPTVGYVDLIEHFSGCLNSAARLHARALDAESLIAEASVDAMTAVLLEAGSSVAFTCGIELLAPTYLHIDCPTLRRQQTQILQEQTTRRRAADTIDQLRRSAELLQEFQNVRASGNLSAGPALERISRADQADALRALLLASAQKTVPSRLWAVAGINLIRIDADAPQPSPLPNELGPLRSVQSDSGGGFLVGARTGIWRVDSDLKECVPYSHPQSASDRGFNAVVASPDRIWAAHSELGLLSWSLDQPAKPDIELCQENSPVPDFCPRNLTLDGQRRVLLTSGNNLFEITEAGELKSIAAPPGSDIAAVFVQPHRIITVHEDGIFCCLDRDDFKLLSQRRLASRFVTAAALPWLGDIRILISTEEGPIQSIGLDDDLITHYASPHLAARRITASAHTVAAVTADRRRLLLWNAWDGCQPRAELHLFSLARHRIADMAFV